MVVGDAPEGIQYPWRAAGGIGGGLPTPSLVTLRNLDHAQVKLLDEDSYLVPELDGVRSSPQYP